MTLWQPCNKNYVLKTQEELRVKNSTPVENNWILSYGSRNWLCKRPLPLVIIKFKYSCKWFLFKLERETQLTSLFHFLIVNIINIINFAVNLSWIILKKFGKYRYCLKHFASIKWQKLLSLILHWFICIYIPHANNPDNL